MIYNALGCVRSYVFLNKLAAIIVALPEREVSHFLTDLIHEVTPKQVDSRTENRSNDWPLCDLQNVRLDGPWKGTPV
jgi:hypothetical protein